MITLLIIGSKGFIGSHATKYFISKGYNCFCCDVVVDYVDQKYFLLDTANSDFNELFTQNRFDFCINCSGAASVPDSILHPISDFSLNVVNVAKILDAIRRHNPLCKFINLSSAAVYGNPARLPIIEEHPLAPVSPYGSHKLYAESVCSDYHKYFNLHTCSLRLFSAYGPGLKKQLLWDICNKIKSSAKVELFGTGNETRDFIFVSDIVLAIECIMHNADFGAGIYNLANGTGITVKEIAHLVSAELNFVGSLTFSGQGREGDPLYWCADINKIKNLGFKPVVKIADGIKKYIAWLQEEALV